MSSMAVLSMILGIVIVWGIPLGIIIVIVILFKKVNRIEKKLGQQNRPFVPERSINNEIHDSRNER
ncbi:hypothetical protein VBD025_16755 [Virgibacillus flavescens]|uniref:hypothetical protein n=1 Tax=Virgibacillus flavescens TaxID=1611422 RepID=UPI003D3357AD